MARHSRPADRAGARALGRVDGVRGQRDGQRVTDRRNGQKRSGRIALYVVFGVVLLGGVLMLVAAPVQSYRDQQATKAERSAELAELEAERAEVRRQTELLDSDEEIRRRAREFFGFVMPGEELYNFLPPASEPIGLPDGWPFSGVERELGAA